MKPKLHNIITAYRCGNITKPEAIRRSKQINQVYQLLLLIGNVRVVRE